MISLPRQWPGIPRAAWPALNRVAAAVETVHNLRTDDSLDAEQGQGTTFMAVKWPERILAQIDSGSNPYAWHHLDHAEAGVYTDPPETPILGGSLAGTAITISSATWAGALVTVTTAVAHGFRPGWRVAIAGVAPGNYNGTYSLLSASGTTFTYGLELQAAPAAGAGGTATPALFRPAYEMNAITSVPAGSKVWLKPRFLRTLDEADQEYEFTYCCTGQAAPSPGVQNFLRSGGGGNSLAQGGLGVPCCEPTALAAQLTPLFGSTFPRSFDFQILIPYLLPYLVPFFRTGLPLEKVGGGKSPLTTKGDLWGYDAIDNRLPVGSDKSLLNADSSQALGLAYVTPNAVISNSTNAVTAVTASAPLASSGGQTPAITSLDLEARLTADGAAITTTFQNISDLSVTLVAGAKYVGRMVVKCNNLIAAEGIKFDFNGGTATTTNFWAAAGVLASSGTDTNVANISTSLAGVINWSTLTGETLIVFEISMVVNAGGTFIPRWAENTSATGTASVELGSYLVLHRSNN